MEDKEPVKFKRGVFIPKPVKRKRGNPNEYFAVPQEGEPTEIDTGITYCSNCKKDMPSINMFIKDLFNTKMLELKEKK